MCHLNFIIRKKNYELTRAKANALVGFTMAVSSSSYITNSDADGVYFSKGKLIRQKNKINMYRYRKELLVSPVILSHQRISTSGKEMKFSQPFIEQGFVFAHNGVVSDYATSDKSDTFNMFQDFLKEFNETDRRWKRENRVKYALEKILAKVSKFSSSYSCGLYDIKEDCLYYFKNNGRSINWYVNNNMVYITTSSTNCKLLGMLRKEDLPAYEVDSLKLYKVKPLANKVDISCLGSLDIDRFRPKEVIKVNKVVKTDCAKGLELLFKEKQTKLNGFKLTNALGRCDFCSTYTHYYNSEKDLYCCDDCREDEYTVNYIEHNEYQAESKYLEHNPYAFLDDEEAEEEEE